MDVDVSPAQPDEIVGAIAELLEHDRPSVDPWWQAGVDENLES